MELQKLYDIHGSFKASLDSGERGEATNYLIGVQGVQLAQREDPLDTFGLSLGILQPREQRTRKISISTKWPPFRGLKLFFTTKFLKVLRE